MYARAVVACAGVLLMAGGCSGPGTDADDGTGSTPTAIPTPVAAPIMELCSDTGRLADGTVAPEIVGFDNTLTCATDVGALEWDQYTLSNIERGDCIWVFADNVASPATAAGDADLFAFVSNSAAQDEVYYGLVDDHSQLDDEAACTHEPWNGFGCPEAAVVAEYTGSVSIYVAQWAGVPAVATCTEDAPYTLYVAVNGVPVDLNAVPSIEDQPQSR